MSSSQTVWVGESNGVPIIGSSKASVELAWALAKGDLELVKKIQNEMLMQAMGMITPVEMEPSSSMSSEASQSAGEPVAEEIPEAHVLQFVSEAPINKVAVKSGE